MGNEETDKLSPFEADPCGVPSPSHEPRASETAVKQAVSEIEAAELLNNAQGWNDVKNKYLALSADNYPKVKLWHEKQFSFYGFISFDTLTEECLALILDQATQDPPTTVGILLSLTNIAKACNKMIQAYSWDPQNEDAPGEILLEIRKSIPKYKLPPKYSKPCLVNWVKIVAKRTVIKMNNSSAYKAHTASIDGPADVHDGESADGPGQGIMPKDPRPGPDEIFEVNHFIGSLREHVKQYLQNKKLESDLADLFVGYILYEGRQGLTSDHLPEETFRNKIMRKMDCTAKTVTNHVKSILNSLGEHRKKQEFERQFGSHQHGI